MIAVDWGTTSFRAYLLDEKGRVLDRCNAPDGILSVAPGTFPAVLQRHLAAWAPQPVLMSGMVGSRQGWKEVPYVQCPAGAHELAPHLMQVAPHAWIVPGVSYVDESGVPDVMRGEETQILGVMDALDDDCLVCLPGTHSKWVRVRGKRIAAFRTHFTGELYSVLKQHSLLGRMMQDGAFDERAFAEGVDRSGDEGGLLHHVFGARTRGLFGELQGSQASAYLSGMLIGHELRSAPPARHVFVLGSAELAGLYEKAARLLGIDTRPLDPEAAPRGLFTLADHIET
jgi:2-dehydro-3-deoxygalactonokinase